MIFAGFYTFSGI